MPSRTRSGRLSASARSRRPTSAWWWPSRVARLGEAGGQRPGARGEQVAQAAGAGQRLPHGGEVARPAAAEAQARQRPFEIGAALEQAAQLLARALLRDEVAHRVEARVDRAGVGERGRQALRQQPAARRGDGAVDDAEQAALAFAGQGAGELQVAPRRRVDRHHPGGVEAPRRLQPRQLALLRELDVLDQRPAGGELGAAEAAEGVEGGDAEGGLEAPLPAAAVEAAGGLRSQDILAVAEQLEEFRLLEQAVGDQQLGRFQARELGGEGPRGDRGGEEVAGGHVEPGQRQLAPRAGEGRQVVVPAGVEQPVLGEGAGGDDPHHRAPHQRLAAAAPGLGGVLDLVADGDAIALANQPLQVGLGVVRRHPGHGDVRAAVLAAARQGDVEGGRRGGGVLEEHLVEIAHSVEEQAVRVLALDGEVLRHHRRRRCGRRLARVVGLFGHVPGRRLVGGGARAAHASSRHACAVQPARSLSTSGASGRCGRAP